MGATCQFLHIDDITSYIIAIKVTAVATTVIGAIASIFSIIGSSLILLVMFKYDSLRTPSNLLLGSLCMTDFITGVIVVPTIAVRRISEAYGEGICTIRTISAYFSYLCIVTSIATVGLISFDRYYAISMPFRYQRQVNNYVYLFIILAMWIILGVYSILPFIHVLTGPTFFKIVFTFMGIIIVAFLVIYARISRIVAAHRRKIRPAFQQNIDATLGNLRNSPSKRDHAISFENSSHVNKLKEHKKTNTIAIVVLVAVACYGPLALVFILRGVMGDTFVLVNIADPWADLVIYINSMINPIIYCLRAKDIRDSLVKILPAKAGNLLRRV